MSVAPASWSPPRGSPPSSLQTIADSLGMYRFTVDQYQRLIDVGVLSENGRYELLRGVILEKDSGASGEDGMGHKPPHALVIALLSSLISRINTPGRHLRIQLPIVLGAEDVPEPDGSIVRGTPRDFAQRLPSSEDTLCVIEVADSSLERDELEKLPSCAAAGIPQFILINLRVGVIEVCSDPNPGRRVYESRIPVKKGQTLSLNLGDGELLEVAAADLLP